MTYERSLINQSLCNINGKVLANYTIFKTGGNNERFSVTRVIVETTEVTGNGNAAKFSIGVVPAAYGEIVPSSPISTDVNKVIIYNPNAEVESIPPNTNVVLRVTNASGATSLVFRVTIQGFYL